MPFKNNESPSLVFKSTATYTLNSGTSETILTSVQLPPLRENTMIQIYMGWSLTNNANNKTWRIRFGTAADLQGSIVAGPTRTTSSADLNFVQIKNRASVVSQIASGGFGPATSARASTAVNTGIETYINFTAQTAVSGDVITLDDYLILVWL